jgi:hypothetical protein
MIATVASVDRATLVIQHNFYVNDWQWGRMFVRVCPYFRFLRVCLNQHHETERRQTGCGRESPQLREPPQLGRFGHLRALGPASSS